MLTRYLNASITIEVN